MKYRNTITGIFKNRPNRFIAYVLVDHNLEMVHVKNTGRCKELLIPGAKVILEIASNPERKTKYDLIAVHKENIGWVNIDSQAPNKVVKEWLESKEKVENIKPEYTYGRSRIDFKFEIDGTPALMEVKGCTLEIDGKGYFPDAPTLRGIKHIEELQRAAEEGYEAYIAFVIQMEGIDEVFPNYETHPEFGEALQKAKKEGVKVLFLGCGVEMDELIINRENGDDLYQ